jgi:hypothetical protein
MGENVPSLPTAARGFLGSLSQTFRDHCVVRRPRQRTLSRQRCSRAQTR